MNPAQSQERTQEFLRNRRLKRHAQARIHAYLQHQVLAEDLLADAVKLSEGLNEQDQEELFEKVDKGEREKAKKRVDRRVE